ncbi:MAG: hypothetical protein F6J87_13475 [Spirulina sp. SIO3F2]|nr:hypothetical protein [Spirulina sp. SIO3F2]
MTQAITIPVESDIQQAFEQASEAERQALVVLVSLFFKEGWANKTLVELMQEMASRGQVQDSSLEISDEIAVAPASQAQPRLMAKLRQIKISADPNLSINHDRHF